jgi:hypothetical protein
VRWNGWGFADTEFALDNRDHAVLTGDRYLFSGKVLESLRPWMEGAVGLDLAVRATSQVRCSCRCAFVSYRIVSYRIMTEKRSLSLHLPYILTALRKW